MLKLIQKRSSKAAVLGLGALATLGTASVAFAGVSSNVYIKPQETFVLGGKQPGDFTVRGTNRGDVSVEVYVRGSETSRLVTTVAPGERFNADFARGEGALLKNTSDKSQAHVKVRITGTTRNLGMSYQGW